MTNNLMTRYVVSIVVLGLAGLCIALNWPINLGIDLRGGSILTYEVEQLDAGGNASEAEDITADEVSDTITVISQRINDQGVKDIQIRQEGERYISLYLANFTKAQADQIRERMTQVGQLTFPIIAEDRDLGYDGFRFNKRTATDDRRAKLEAGQPYVAPKGFAFVPRLPQRTDKMTDAEYEAALATYRDTKLNRPAELEGEWVYFDPEYWDESRGYEGFTGRSIKDARKDFDQNGGRAVTYKVLEQYQNDFGLYTGKYTGRSICLVLNNELWSSANIQGTLTDNVQITKGGGYTEAEQSWLINCLKSGSLKLRPKLVSQDEIGATLGKTAIEHGMMAFLFGMLVVVGMMLYYYRSSGLIAVLALVANFVLIFGVLMLLEASLTLPGIAGLVLTVGMAVDANILIFERIREEIAKGKAPLQAAKNGFDRAFVTIFDANLTTFIVAALLYFYGKGPIKGFGITLMAGIVCTMFSALYLTRTMMGMVLKRGGMKEFNYRGVLPSHLKIDFVSRFKKFAIISLLAATFGIVVTFATGRSKYGLDFNGGTSMRLAFNEALAEADVRDRIAGLGKYENIEITMIDPVDGKSGVVKVNLDYHPPEKSAASRADGEDEYDAIQSEIESVFSGKLVSRTLTGVSFSDEGTAWEARLNLTSTATQDQVLEVMRKAGIETPRADRIQEIDKSKVNGTEVWQIGGTVTAAKRASVETGLYDAIREAGETMSASTPFQEVRFVGPKVVADLKSSAIQAMLAALVLILGYIWFRFKEVKYGFAATIALVHDVLVALGVTVACKVSGLVNVPITLDVIAAFLTIIGYSLNDTIIVFDRIRENRGNMRGTFADVVNRSVNQTLSRTILTSATTAVVVAAIFFSSLGIESPLEGFAFTLLVGIIVGTYSSVFIASPVLVWLNNREEAAAEKSKASRNPATV
ncbi:MAG: protein translocase subunit SecD [Planctomycetota bacterium]